LVGARPFELGKGCRLRSEGRPPTDPSSVEAGAAPIGGRRSTRAKGRELRTDDLNSIPQTPSRLIRELGAAGRDNLDIYYEFRNASSCVIDTKVIVIATC
jgi:hypothetical protein